MSERANLTFTIEASSTQKVTALREGAAAWLEEQGATVLNRLSAPFYDSFMVEGVDTKRRQAFKEVVEAASIEEAKEEVGSETKVITSARPLMPEAESQGE